MISICFSGFRVHIWAWGKEEGHYTWRIPHDNLLSFVRVPYNGIYIATHRGRKEARRRRCIKSGRTTCFVFGRSKSLVFF